nr:MAG TPA: hypothetical protein [Caudoviricetes sp.]
MSCGKIKFSKILPRGGQPEVRRWVRSSKKLIKTNTTAIFRPHRQLI